MSQSRTDHFWFAGTAATLKNSAALTIPWCKQYIARQSVTTVQSWLVATAEPNAVIITPI
ncbi:hypothetical protein HHX48_04225 [Salinimonas sp. HHU 13199]|uniref:Uncharacterized protein n=1 Tax=Salinimonas profundi TaxID=2729140 RepID=A0ABR8LFA8_9ALTE|nr:hypothetical protein [Salinimonas profundi]